MHSVAAVAGERTPREFASFSPPSTLIGFRGSIGVRSETFQQLIAHEAIGVGIALSPHRGRRGCGNPPEAV